MKKALFAASLVLSLSAGREAAAVERQHQIGLGPQLSVLAIDGKSTASVGGGLALHYSYGVNDTWNFVVEASSAVVAHDQDQDTPETPRTRPAGVDHGAFGVGYVIDVLQWVPYLSALGGVYRLSGGTLEQDLFLPGVSIGAGLDYQLSRKLAVGIGVREHLLLGALSTYPSYTTAFLRAGYMWGW